MLPPPRNAEALARAQLFEALVDRMPAYVGVWALPEGESDARALMLVTANRRAFELMAPHQGAGVTMEDVLHTAIVSTVGRVIVRAIRTGQTIDVGPREWLRSDGRVLQLYAQVVPLASGVAAYVAYEQ